MRTCIEHDSQVHLHWHSHGPVRSITGKAWRRQRACARHLQKLGMFHTLRPLFVGLVHGLAGSAAVALLVLSTIREPQVGGSLFAGFRSGNDCGDDADHGGDCSAVFLRGV